jgi:hypothetical protein
VVGKTEEGKRGLISRKAEGFTMVCFVFIDNALLVVGFGGKKVAWEG